MQAKLFLGIVIALAIVGVGAFALSSLNKVTNENTPAVAPVTETTPTPEVPVSNTQTDEVTQATSSAVSSVKEFTMTAFYDDKGVWYSLKEMSVKKGDTVRVKVTNTKGMHDFTIDELGIKKELPLNEEVTVEFTADKVGDFVYYCSKMGHRAKGQWGTLHVSE